MAERLGDGWFVRVSEERLSLVAFFGTLALPIGLVLCGACLVAPQDIQNFGSQIYRESQRLQPIVCEKSIAMSLIGEHVVVKGNESLLEQAVVNLMENALRYTSAGGTVMVAMCPLRAHSVKEALLPCAFRYN